MARAAKEWILPAFDVDLNEVDVSNVVCLCVVIEGHRSDPLRTWPARVARRRRGGRRVAPRQISVRVPEPRIALKRQLLAALAECKLDRYHRSTAVDPEVVEQPLVRLARRLECPDTPAGAHESVGDNGVETDVRADIDHAHPWGQKSGDEIELGSFEPAMVEQELGDLPVGVQTDVDAAWKVEANGFVGPEPERKCEASEATIVPADEGMLDPPERDTGAHHDVMDWNGAPARTPHRDDGPSAVHRAGLA